MPANCAAEIGGRVCNAVDQAVPGAEHLETACKPFRIGEARAFLVPNVFGDGLGMFQFRAELRNYIAFEMLQRAELEDPIRLSSDMDVMGEFFADQVQKRAPGKPVILAGYSFGAYAALATALALQERGIAVWLCLLDPLPGQLPAPKYPTTAFGLAKAVFSRSPFTLIVRGLLLLGCVGVARRLTLMLRSHRDWKGDLERRRRVLRYLGLVAVTQWRPTSFHERRRRLFNRLGLPTTSVWRPTAFRGRTILFATQDFERAGDPSPVLNLFVDLTVIRVEGGHWDIFKGAALQTIIEALSRIFEE
jgi:thioesterase domain-containing protein